VLAEDRHERLILERDERRVRPRLHRVVGDVRERHRAAWRVIARRAHRDRQAIGERALLRVAARTALRAVAAHAHVVEEATPQLDLRRVHRVVGWHRGYRDARRKPPVPAGLGLTRGERGGHCNGPDGHQGRRRPGRTRRSRHAQRASTDTRLCVAPLGRPTLANQAGHSGSIGPDMQPTSPPRS
jgi:hypothetical protein